MAFLVIHRGTGTIMNAHECELVVVESSDELDTAVENDDVDEIVRLASSVIKITDLSVVPESEPLICPRAGVHHHQIASGMSVQFHSGHEISLVPEQFR